jgi:hypothetical protein
MYKAYIQSNILNDYTDTGNLIILHGSQTMALQSSNQDHIMGWVPLVLVNETYY